MKTKKIFTQYVFLTVLSSIILTLCNSAHAKTSLWKVSKDNNYLYIGGTIHILGKNDYPLPPEYEKSYKDSKTVILETDLQKMESLDFQMKMIDTLSYQNSETIKDHLNKETLSELENYLKKNNIPLFTVQKFKPGMIVSLLTVTELKKLGIDSEGVDSFFNSKAIKDQKGLGELETIEEQLSFLSSMGEKNTNEFILYTLRDLKEFPKLFSDLKNAWLTGDMSTMNTIGIQPMLKDFPETYETLIKKRNNAWVPKIEAMFKTNEVEMVLVGALHLAGPDSVLTQLESLGYKIEQF